MIQAHMCLTWGTTIFSTQYVKTWLNHHQEISAASRKHKIKATVEKIVSEKESGKPILESIVLQSVSTDASNRSLLRGIS